MAEWVGYFYIEDLGLADAQRSTLVSALRAWGTRNTSLYPNERNHWAVRPDNKAVIFEAVFDADNLTAAWFQNKLAEIFSVSASSITYTTNQTSYGPLATFQYNSVSKLRLGLFGGLSAAWAESRIAALAYLAANQEAWGES